MIVTSYYAVLTIFFVKIDDFKDAGEEYKLHHSYSITNLKMFKSKQSPFMHYHHHNFFLWRVIMKTNQLYPLHLSSNLELKRNPCVKLHLYTIIHKTIRQQEWGFHRIDHRVANVPNTVTLKRGRRGEGDPWNSTNALWIRRKNIDAAQDLLKGWKIHQLLLTNGK